MKLRDAKPGMRVTCKYAVPAYYSKYAGNPEMLFRPGMIGIVASITPKVRIIGDPPTHDKNPMFLVVDYAAPETGKTERVGLNFCNAREVTPK